ncbi:unnamed protein product [Lathyrus sativus]|nr:unnamed protein product [Lathyrus sativus]
MIVRSLNIRGGGNYSKRRRIICIINSGKAYIFLIQESKLKEVDRKVIGNLWNNQEVIWYFNKSHGQFKGIITMWNENSIQCVFTFSGEGFLGVKVVWKNEFYYVINVYSGCSINSKRKLWVELCLCKRKWLNGKWIIGGDFNAVSNSYE